MTRAIAATQTAMEKAIRAADKAGSNRIVLIGRDGSLAIVPAPLVIQDNATYKTVRGKVVIIENEQETLDEKKDNSF